MRRIDTFRQFQYPTPPLHVRGEHIEQAHRLLDVARALAAIHEALTAGTETSRTRDTRPAATAALDYGLSQRALIAVSSRADDIAELNYPPPLHAHPQRPADSRPTVRAVVRQAVRDLRTAPTPPPTDPPANPAVAEME